MGGFQNFLEYFDVIILGTGITESILAGALCRVGRSVLHLDENGHYGAEFATLTLREAIEWGKCQRANPVSGTPSAAGGNAETKARAEAQRPGHGSRERPARPRKTRPE